MSKLYDFEVQTIDNKRQSLRVYVGKWLVIVNVASRCQFTSQYEGLEALYRKYKEKGVAVLGFPCDQFGNQEPGTEQEIHSFCSINYDITFPMFSKIEVNGPQTHPLYGVLKREAKGLLGKEDIQWNFTKFLVDRSGKVLKRYAPAFTPDFLDKELGQLLSPA